MDWRGTTRETVTASASEFRERERVEPGRVWGPVGVGVGSGRVVPLWDPVPLDP